jgi:hypothetical protein
MPYPRHAHRQARSRFENATLSRAVGVIDHVSSRRGAQQLPGPRSEVDTGPSRVPRQSRGGSKRPL